MSAAIVACASAEFSLLKKLIHDQFRIPEDVFARVGLSGFWLSIYVDRDDLDPLEFEAEWRNFEELSSSADHVPKEALLFLSIAYASAAMAFQDGAYELTDSERLQVLLAAAEAKMAALLTYQMQPGEQAKSEAAERKTMLSNAGVKGAKTKNQKFEVFREWVRSKSANLRFNHRTIARQLSAALPAQLADLSKHPERLIYDVLREGKKIN